MRPQRHPDVVHERIDGRVVLVDPAGTEVITLNEAGSVVWEMLDGVRDVRALAAALGDVAIEDVEAFVVELAGAGLVVERDA